MIDLHAHTTVSDGTVTPKELIRLAKSIGLTAVAITDHDSIEGIREAQKEADKLGMTLVKGIELDVVYGDDPVYTNRKRMHVLGLGIDPENEAFLNIYKTYRASKNARLDHVFEGLRAMGVDVNPEDIHPHMVGEFMDRQAIAKWLVAENFVPMMKYAWVDYLDKIEFIEGELIDAQTAIDAVHTAGGKAFMAHFHLKLGLRGYTDEEARLCLKDCKAMGLDGLEYYYPSFTKEDRLKCGQYIEDFGFLKSGGSDFHGSNRPHIALGTGDGDFSIPDELLENILPKEERRKIG